MSFIVKTINIAEESARENGLTHISSVEIEVGEMTGAIPDLLQSCYKQATKDTILAGSKLIIKNVPVTALCEKCQTTYLPNRENDYLCPACHSGRSRIIAGRDVIVKRISE